MLLCLILSSRLKFLLFKNDESSRCHIEGASALSPSSSEWLQLAPTHICLRLPKAKAFFFLDVLLEGSISDILVRLCLFSSYASQMLSDIVFKDRTWTGIAQSMQKKSWFTRKTSANVIFMMSLQHAETLEPLSLIIFHFMSTSLNESILNQAEQFVAANGLEGLRNGRQLQSWFRSEDAVATDTLSWCEIILVAKLIIRVALSSSELVRTIPPMSFSDLVGISAEYFPEWFQIRCLLGWFLAELRFEKKPSIFSHQTNSAFLLIESKQEKNRICVYLLCQYCFFDVNCFFKNIYL